MVAKIMIMGSALLYGMGFLGVQGALDTGWLPFALLAVRGIIAGIILLAIGRFKSLGNRKLVRSSATAGLVMGLGFALQSYGQSFSNVSTASILTGLYVLITPFLAVLLKKHRLDVKVYLAGIIAFVAVVLISYQQQEISFALGEVLLVSSAIAYSWHFLLVESLTEYQAACTTSGIQLVTMGLVSTVLMLVSGQSLPGTGWPYVLFLALFCSALAFILQVYGQQQLKSSVVSTLLSFESVFGVIGAVIVFNETLNWQVAMSCGLMLMAIYLLQGKS